MEKTILVTGKDTYLGNEISKHFLSQGAKVGISVTPSNQEAHPSFAEDSRLLTVPWHRRSPISAKNFVLQTTNQLGELDEAWVIFTADHEVSNLTETSTSVIEESLDETVKSLVFLARELLSYQAKRPNFRLIFVLFDENRQALAPTPALEYFAARAFITAVLHTAARKNLPIWAYESAIPQAEAFAQFVLGQPRSLDPDKAGGGRWQLYEEKKNLFSSFFSKRNDA